MVIETTRFGRLEVDSSRVITFSQGMIGFAHLREFILLDHKPGSPFHWLQSLERGELAFPMASPDHFVEGYTVSPPEGLSEILGDYELKDLWLGAVVTFPQGSGGATLNLRAPVFLNTKTRQGVQAVLDDPNVPIRFPIGQKR